MSVHNMKPQFTDSDGYREWLAEWRVMYDLMSEDIRQSKFAIKAAQRNNEHAGVSRLRKERRYKRVMAQKLMTVLNEAKIRWQNIRDIKGSISAQMAEFPLTVGDCRNIDFHFNKKSLEFPFVPSWVVKAKGKSYYVNHVDCETAWTTRETPDHPSTKGAIRIKRGTVHITTDGNAVIS